MGFSDILSGGLISGVGSVLSSGLNAITANRNTKKMINAQKEMNQRNIESQERINQQNIDFQQGVNDIMRKDAHNAIAIKKRDLINSGYSTANPDMQGNPVASLGSPTLTAPQVESEYNSDMANYQQSANQSFADSLINSASAMSNIALQKAQIKSQNANTTNMEIQNDMLEAQLKVNYQNSVKQLQLLDDSHDINKQTLEKGVKEIELIDGQIQSIKQQVISLVTDNKWKDKKYKTELAHISAMINNISADTDNKKIEKDLNNIKLKFAKMGINFDSNSFFDSFVRIAASNDADKLFGILKTFITDSLSAITDSFVSVLPESLKPQNLRNSFNKMISKYNENFNPMFNGLFRMLFGLRQ